MNESYKLVPADPTPEMIAAAWSAWKSRHGGKLGPGPGFVEAIKAAIEAAPEPPLGGIECPPIDPDLRAQLIRNFSISLSPEMREANAKVGILANLC